MEGEWAVDAFYLQTTSIHCRGVHATKRLDRFPFIVVAAVHEDTRNHFIMADETPRKPSHRGRRSADWVRGKQSRSQHNPGYLQNGASNLPPGATPLLPNQGRVIQTGPIRVLCIADVRGKLRLPSCDDYVTSPDRHCLQETSSP